MVNSSEAVKRAVEIIGSQVKLAAAAGCAQQTISDIISGRRTLSAELAVAISRATDGRVSREDLRPDIFGDPASSESAA